MYVSYEKDVDLDKPIHYAEEGPTIIMMVGVNGVGKTTTIAKLTHRFLKEDKKVLLVAADTFRAGAVEQLGVWADRLHVDIVKGKENADPSSVIFDGMRKAKSSDYDIVIVDTAGRLQTKINLMNEIAKMCKVIKKEFPEGPHETYLVIDATTGQNGVFQAKVFAEVTGVSGIVLTKMDGTSKGGIVLAMKDQLQIPVRFIGLGEGVDDLMEFDLEQYLNGLVGIAVEEE
jgi:fused signal recognition particle receptor